MRVLETLSFYTEPGFPLGPKCLRSISLPRSVKTILRIIVILQQLGQKVPRTITHHPLILKTESFHQINATSETDQRCVCANIPDEKVSITDLWGKE